MSNYRTIVDHYESCLFKFGDSNLGVDWPNAQDADKRYHIMCQIFNSKLTNDGKISLLDFGCGASHLYEFICKNKLHNINYSGLDLSAKFIELSREKFPENRYYIGDILDPVFTIPNFDFIIMNGVFTEKRELSYKEMLSFFKSMIIEIFSYCNIGIAFNVMSKNVDWERDDLFHLSLDELTEFLSKLVSKNYIIRSDYGLYEYTVYLYR